MNYSIKRKIFLETHKDSKAHHPISDHQCIVR